MCGHWSLCTFNFEVSQWPDRDFLKCLEPQRRNPFSWSLQIGSKLEHAFRAKPGAYNSALAFTSCSCRSQRSGKVEAQGPVQSFLSMRLALGVHLALQIPRYTWESFEALITPNLPPYSPPLAGKPRHCTHSYWNLAACFFVKYSSSFCKCLTEILDFQKN